MNYEGLLIRFGFVIQCRNTRKFWRRS